jgi:hypothetical protein
MASIDQSKLSHRGYISSQKLKAGKYKKVRNLIITEGLSLAGLSEGANAGVDPITPSLIPMKIVALTQRCKSPFLKYLYRLFRCNAKYEQLLDKYKIAFFK